jgi:hypothetical protein
LATSLELTPATGRRPNGDHLPCLLRPPSCRSRAPSTPPTSSLLPIPSHSEIGELDFLSGLSSSSNVDSAPPPPPKRNKGKAPMAGPSPHVVGLSRSRSDFMATARQAYLQSRPQLKSGVASVRDPSSRLDDEGWQ